MAVYKDIATHIKDLIIRGRLHSGDRISLRSLTGEFGVSKNTVERAFSLLKELNIITTVPKSGTTVTAQAWNIVTQTRSPDWDGFSSMGLHKQNRDLLFTMANSLLNPDTVLYRYSYGFYEQDFSAYAYLNEIFPRLDWSKITSEMENTPGESPCARLAVAKHMKQYGIETPAENILIFNNMLQAYNTVIMSFLRHGSNIYAAHPNMIGCMELLPTIGANLYSLSTDRHGICPEDLERRISNKKHNILYINPVNHFPTGHTMSEGRRGEILAVCQKHRLPVIENDILRDMWLTEPPPPLKKDDSHQQIIYIGSFSNAFSYAHQGAWVIAPSSVIRRLGDVKYQLYDNMNPLMLHLMAEILSGGHYTQAMAHCRTVQAERVKSIEASLKKHMGGIARWSIENIAYHLWLRFESSVDTAKLLTECPEVSFLPGAWFHDPGHILLSSVCSSVSSLDDALRTLGERVKFPPSPL